MRLTDAVPKGGELKRFPGSILAYLNPQSLILRFGSDAHRPAEALRARRAAMLDVP